MNIVITGSSSGIGRALVERLLRHQHDIWGLARSGQEDLSARFPGRFFSSRCDVSEWKQVAAAHGQVSARWAHVDALVTCAGLQGEVGPTMMVDPLKWSGTVRANLDGTFYAIRAFHGILRKSNGRAKVVCFSGGGATKARPNFSAYGVAKTGVVRLVETLAEELQHEPLDINSVAPGAINTRLTDEVIKLGPNVSGEAEYRAALKQKEQGGASLEKALDLVEWLLSPKSDGITGRLISAPWDNWEALNEKAEALRKSDVYQLRRILPEERNF